MLKLEPLEQDWQLVGDKIEQKSEQPKGQPLFNLYRAKIPGGWLVLMMQCNEEHSSATYGSYGLGWGYGGATFVPDPEHKWDGSSIN